MGSFVAVGVASEGSNASRTPALPAGIVAGDLLLILTAIRNSGAGVPNAPAGYSTLLDQSNFKVFGKIASASESAPTVTYTGGVLNATCHAVMAAFRDVALTPIAAAGALNGSVQDIAVPALGAAIDAQRTLLLRVGWKQDDWTSVATIASMTEISETSTITGDDAGIVWDYQFLPDETSTAGSSNFVVTGGAAAISRGGVIALDASPAFTAVVQDVWPPRVLLSLTGLTSGDAVAIYREVGTVRTLVRAASDDSVTDPSFLRIDAELPFGRSVYYVATVNGDWEYYYGPDTYTLTGGKVALTDAITGLSAEVVILAWPEQAFDPSATVFKVGGRNVVVQSDLGMFTGTIELYAETTAISDAIEALLRNSTEGIFQVRQPGGYDGVDCYLAVSAAACKRFSQDGSDDRRTWSLQAVQTESWAEALEASGYTLLDLANAYDTLTLADVAADFSTLLQLAQAELT